MVMSRDHRSKFRKIFYVFLILHLILGNVTKFLVEKPSTSEIISQKPHGGEKHPTVLLGLKWHLGSHTQQFWIFVLGELGVYQK